MHLTDPRCLVRLLRIVYWGVAVTLGAAQAQAQPMVDIIGNVYCRSAPSAGERPWGGVRVSLKERPEVSGESEPEHGRFKLSLPESYARGQKLTLVYSQSNLKLSEEERVFDSDQNLVLAGRTTFQVEARVFEVSYCVELEAPRLREMVRTLLDRISHRSALVHGELMRSRAYGNPETAACLDDVLNRMGAYLRQAESRAAPFMDALGEDPVRARREVNRIKIADERAEELAREADFCLEHQVSRPGPSSQRYVPDLEVSPAGVTVVDDAQFRHPAPYRRPLLARVSEPSASRLDLVPSVSFETGYDSNFLERSGAARLGGWQFRPLAHLALRYNEARSEADLPANETELVEPLVEGRASLLGVIVTRDRDDTSGLDHYSDVAVTADVLGRFRASESLKGLVYGQLERRVEPESAPEYQTAFGQNDLNLGADLRLQLGGGRFDVGTGYTLGVVAHDSVQQTIQNRLQHRLVLHERLQFLPETAWVHETEVRLRYYWQADSPLSDSAQLRSRLGLIGMFQRRLGFTGLVGWAMSDYEDKNPQLSEMDGIIARAKLEWFISPPAMGAYRDDRFGRSSIAVMYDRDYRDNVTSDYYRRDRGSLSLYLARDNAWFWQVEAGLSNVAYASYVDAVAAGASTTAGSVTGTDSERRVDIDVIAEYRLFKSLRGLARFVYARAISEVVPVGADGSVSTYSLGYERIQFMLGARWLR